MPREIKKQRGIFERPKGSGIWWICYAGIDGQLHREKVGMRQAAINVYQLRKTQIRLGTFAPEDIKNKHKSINPSEIIDDYIKASQALDFSQIFEFYVNAVNPKPKATLEEILEDYCYQTDEGNWRPALTDPEKKEKGSERQRAVRRKIQRFCNLLNALDAISENQRPDAATLAEWIRHCRRTGLHAQGKLLYERGGDLSALSEQAQVDVEEDYQVCVKHLERSSK